MSLPKTYKSEGIVLKRINIGEGDRIITFLTRDHGKITAIAKGVRKISSKRAGSLEIATQGEFYFRKGKSLDLITQTKYIHNFPKVRENLVRITQVHQLLEIVNLLTVDNHPIPQAYQITISTLQKLESDATQKQMLLNNIRQIIKVLGFTHDKQFTETGLKQYIEELTERNLKSKIFLTPTPTLTTLKSNLQ